MKKLCFLSAFLSAAVMADVQTITTSHQCWASGNSFRVQGEKNANSLVDSRIGFQIKSTKSVNTYTLDLIGHVAFAKFVDGKKDLDIYDGYSHLLGEDIKSHLSPTASVYRDADYVRFNVESIHSSAHDSGNLTGYLVINREVFTKSAQFDAHLVFRHGDHTGGTIDYTCWRE